MAAVAAADTDDRIAPKRLFNFFFPFSLIEVADRAQLHCLLRMCQLHVDCCGGGGCVALQTL